MSQATDQEKVTTTIDQRGVATIEFFHPLSNSLPGKVLNSIAQTISKAVGGGVGLASVIDHTFSTKSNR